MNNDPVNWVDLWGLAQEYAEDVNGRPIVALIDKTKYQWPVADGRITSAFGTRKDAKPAEHPGIDIAPVKPGEKGQDIFAAKSGVIIIAGTSLGGSSEIHILHWDGEVSVYKHHSYESVKVKKGDTIKKGEKIAEMSDVGSKGAVHLHFEIRPAAGLRQKDAIDPIPKLSAIPSKITLTEGIVANNGTLKNK